MPEDRLISAENQTGRDPALRNFIWLILLGRGRGAAILKRLFMPPLAEDDAMDHTLLHGPPGLEKPPWHRL